MVAFLVTEVVSSIRLRVEHADAMSSDLVGHDDMIGRAVLDHGGRTISTVGGSFAAAFDRANEAVAAAVAAQRELAASTWRVPDGIRARMGIHLDAAPRGGDGWYGPPLNETARMTAVAHGGQIVVSEPVAARLPDLTFVDLGDHRLRDLDGTRRLLQVVVQGLRAEFPPLRSMARYAMTLPAQRTPLIGRDELIAQVRRRLLEHRLVSLIGPGGVGKTRAAIETAGRELPNFPGGVFFVDLTAAASDADVVGAVISGLRMSVSPEQTSEEQLAAHLAHRHALLVFDNCEHVVDRAAELVDLLLDAARDVRVLVTSREPLQIEGEVCLPVPSLDVDGPGSAAVRLFLERALAADDASVIAETERETVAEITRRLDGIPLALELAAAQVGTLSPEQILTRLDDRFRFLKREGRDTPPRQRTLEAAIAWSYELLHPDEQQDFRRLAVCAGPFTLPTAARMFGVDEVEAVDRLDALVSRSLITRIRYGGLSHGYDFLESLRAFAQRALAEAGESAQAEAALEAALVPSSRLLGDWSALANEYLSANDVTIVIEDVTRRVGARRALDAGRLDAAALIYSSCAFRDDSGALEVTLGLVAPLAARREDLDPVAWRSASAAKLLLERLTRRYNDCLGTAIGMLAVLDEDDPSRGWFDLWRCALTTAVAPEAGIAEIDAVLPSVLRHARPPRDWLVSQFLGSKATGLALVRRLDDARAVADESVVWAPVGRESRDQALALSAWLRYLTGAHSDGDLEDDIGAQNQELGLAELCAAPGVLCAARSIDERTALLVASARRRPSMDVPTPYLLAFAWLAVERGDDARAHRLVATAELYDASTHLALMHLLARLDGWKDETWERERDVAIGRYLSPHHEAAAAQGIAVLVDEVAEWERTQLYHSALERT